MKKIILINILIFFTLIFLLEVSARVYIYLKYKTQHAGLEVINMHLKYEPYVMFGKNWKVIFEQYLNKKNNHDINILLLGGSVAQGFPSELLENAIENKYKKNVKVFNAGMGGYISTQELVLLTRYGYKLKPDVIINLNGANDIIHSLRKTNSPGTFYLNKSYELFLTKPILAPLFKLLQYSQFYNGLIRLGDRNINYKDKDFTDYLSIYMDNVENMKLFSNAIGSNYYNFLQPHVLFKLNKHINEKNFTPFNYRSEIVTKLYQNIANRLSSDEKLNSYFIDTTNIFETNFNHIFSDDVHFVSDEGYKILANYIASSIIFRE